VLACLLVHFIFSAVIIPFQVYDHDKKMDFLVAGCVAWNVRVTEYGETVTMGKGEPMVYFKLLFQNLDRMKCTLVIICFFPMGKKCWCKKIP
jgi:hypothetical protein